MIGKIAVLALAAAGLCGCVLQSPAPLYADRHSELALGRVGGTTETASLHNGQWVIDGERSIIAVEGKHYVVRGKTNVTLHFARLKDDWFVVQGREDDGPAAYLLAEVKDRVATVRPVFCSDLKADAGMAAYVEHQGDDCFIRAQADAKKLFTSLTENPGEKKFRLQIIH